MSSDAVLRTSERTLADFPILRDAARLVPQGTRLVVVSPDDFEFPDTKGFVAEAKARAQQFIPGNSLLAYADPALLKVTDKFFEDNYPDLATELKGIPYMEMSNIRNGMVHGLPFVIKPELMNGLGLLALPFANTPKEVYAAWLSGIEAAHLKNLPGEDSEWLNMIVFHELDHLHPMPAGVRNDGLLIEARADMSAKQTCLSDIFRKACGQDAAEAMLSMRALAAFSHGRDSYSVHNTSAVVNIWDKNAVFTASHQQNSHELKLAKDMVDKSISRSLTEKDLDSYGLPNFMAAQYYQHTKKLYQAGAFDTLPIGKQFAYDFLDAAKRYAPDYHKADINDTFLPPMVSIIDYARKMNALEPAAGAGAPAGP